MPAAVPAVLQLNNCGAYQCTLAGRVLSRGSDRAATVDACVAAVDSDDILMMRDVCSKEFKVRMSGTGAEC